MKKSERTVLSVRVGGGGGGGGGGLLNLISFFRMLAVSPASDGICRAKGDTVWL